MTYTPLFDHQHHITEVRKGKGPHIAEYFCVQCQRHIAWLSREEYRQWQRKMPCLANAPRKLFK